MLFFGEGKHKLGASCPQAHRAWYVTRTDCWRLCISLQYNFLSGDVRISTVNSFSVCCRRQIGVVAAAGRLSGHVYVKNTRLSTDFVSFDAWKHGSPTHKNRFQLRKTLFNVLHYLTVALVVQ